MKILILRISLVTYLLSVSAVMLLVFYPSADVPTEVLSYMQWWYPQPNTEIEEFVSTLGAVALLISFFSAIAMLFLKNGEPIYL